MIQKFVFIYKKNPKIINKFSGYLCVGVVASLLGVFLSFQINSIPKEVYTLPIEMQKVFFISAYGGLIFFIGFASALFSMSVCITSYEKDHGKIELENHEP